jgi:hypothetical protein
LQALQKVESEVKQRPPRWSGQFEALKQEAHLKLDETHRAATGDWPAAPEYQTAEVPAPFNATVLMQPGVVPAEEGARFDAGRESDFSEPARFAPDAPSFHEENPAIAPELMEFLEPVRPGWSRPVVWIGIAAIILAGVLLSVIFLPRQERAPVTKPGSIGGTASSANYSYAEINAEPWGTIKEITPANGEAQSAIGSATPLRVKLPAGQYSLTLEGPNHEQKRVEITVPKQGGTACLVLFRKPDLRRILSEK